MDKRGSKENNKQNFANNKALASKAGKKSKSPANAILKSDAIREGKHKRITPAVQEEIRNALTSDDGNGHAYLTNFINNFLSEAKSDPNSRCGQLLASALFSADTLTILDSEMNKQMAKDAEFIKYRIRQTLYDKQQEVYDDMTSRTIQAICTRRAGKTELVARMVVRDAVSAPYLTPTGKPLARHALYLNRTFDNAVSQLGKPVMTVLDSLDIKYTGSPGSGTITLDNGNQISFGGYNNKGDIDKFRGEHYSLICIDEVSHLRNPETLMKETLEPALIDFGDEARIIMTGTPPRIKANYAYRQWHNPNIKHYHWSFMDNPYIPNKEKVLETVCKEHNCDTNAPFVQREYFGNLEAFDEDAMIFRGYKTFDKLPQNVTFDYAFVGVDFGYEDDAAVISCLVKGKTLYVIKDWSESHKSISDIAAVILEHLANLRTYKCSRTPWVICDNNEKSAVFELYQTYKIQNAYCAYKYNKVVALDQLADWMRAGNILINENCKALVQDAENTVWKRDEESDALLHEPDDDAYHGNSIYALLYISRQYAFDVMGLTDTNKSAKQILES